MDQPLYEFVPYPEGSQRQSFVPFSSFCSSERERMVGLNERYYQLGQRVDTFTGRPVLTEEDHVHYSELMKTWNELHQTALEVYTKISNQLYCRPGLLHERQDFDSSDGGNQVFVLIRDASCILLNLYGYKLNLCKYRDWYRESNAQSGRSMPRNLRDEDQWKVIRQMILWAERSRTVLLAYELTYPMPQLAPDRASSGYTSFDKLREFLENDDRAWESILASQNGCGPGTVFVEYHQTEYNPRDLQKFIQITLLGPKGETLETAFVREDTYLLAEVVCKKLPKAMGSGEEYRKSEDDIMMYLQGLFDKYIKPIYKELKRLCPSVDQKVVFCASGVLARIPFALLRNREDKTYLFQHHTVAVTPSLRVLQVCKERWSTLEELPLLSVGAGVVVGDAAYNTKVFERLEGSIKEVDDICALFDDENKLQIINLQGTKATVDALVTQARTASNQKCCQGFIHLAVHGDVDEDYPRGALFLADPRVGIWPTTGGQGECGRDWPIASSVLSYESISGSDFTWNAHMAVLSACKSGQGKVFLVEGVFNLPRAFMVAGVPCSVVSQWVVGDNAQSTPKLMRLFYTALRSGRDVATALQMAMVEMHKAHDPLYSLAPFVVWGLPSVRLPCLMQG